MSKPVYYYKCICGNSTFSANYEDTEDEAQNHAQLKRHTTTLYMGKMDIKLCTFSGDKDHVFR